MIADRRFPFDGSKVTNRRGASPTRRHGWWRMLAAIVLSAGVTPQIFASELIMIPIDDVEGSRAASAEPMQARAEAPAGTPSVSLTPNSWYGGPTANLRVTALASIVQFSPQVSDGAGGSIVVWEDFRNAATSNIDIYAHHILACGILDPAWPANGVALTTAPGSQSRPTLVPDGLGGAIVVWVDNRSGFGDAFADIYAQHVLATGAVAPGWPANGLGVCTAANRQRFPKIASDGSGGAFVTWDDSRFGIVLGLRRVFVQHLLPSGVDPGWTVNGNRACPSVEADQVIPVICSDGTGGAIVAWDDRRYSAVDLDIFAQRISPTGTLLWPAAGQAVSLAPGAQVLNGANPGFLYDDLSSGVHNNAIVPDGASGCFITWADERGFATSDQDCYGQHLTAAGSVAPGWVPDGVGLCVAPGRQNGPKALSDGAGGMFATWVDGRPMVLVQHVSVAGAIDGPAGGLPMSTAAGTTTLNGVSDGATGAVYAWNDFRSLVDTDIFAHHVLSVPAFMVDAGWPVNGAPVASASGTQFQQLGGTVVPDGFGGAIVAWTDIRSNPNRDIYAQRILASGTLPDTPGPGCDFEPPVITCPADIVECSGANVALGIATATDNVGVPAVTHNAPATFPFGTTVVTWTALDAAGNVATCQQRVTIPNCPMYNTLSQGFFSQSTGRFCGNGLATADLIVSLLNTELVVGRSRTASFKLRKSSSSDAACLISMLPGNGSAASLPRGDGRFTSSCGTTTGIPLVNGRFSILLAQTITLGLDLRLPNSTLGSLRLAGEYMTVQDAADGPDGICGTGDDVAISGSSEVLTIPRAVLDRLGASNTVLDLYQLANTGLAGLDTGVMGPAPLDAIAQAIESVCNGFDQARFLVGFSAAPGLPDLARFETPALEPAPGGAERPGLPGSGRPAFRVAPNPVASSTRILYDVTEAGDWPVNVGVFDVAGRRLRTLVDQVVSSGRHEIAWDGTDDRQTRLKEGLYFVRVTVGGAAATRGVVLLRR